MGWLWKSEGKGGMKDDTWVFGLRTGVDGGAIY